MNKTDRRAILSREIQRCIGMIFAAALFGIAYSWFLIPYNIAPGGVAGISQIVFRFTGFRVGMTMIALNIPLFVVSFVFIGRSFGGKSIYGMLLTAILTDFFNLQNLAKLGLIENLQRFVHNVDGRTVIAMLDPQDIYLSAIAGSVLLGLGIGLMFRFRGSTGGTDIPVALIKQKAGLSIGTCYWLVETLIIFSVGLLFQDLKLVIWGYVNLFITTKITDLASEGLPYIKGVYIISEAVQEIRKEILEKLERGVTLFDAVSGYNQRPIKVIFCVLNRRQVPQLTDIVKDLDPDAFMIVTDVNDVLGYGFKSRQINLTE
ncbi:MAG: YitT family protein [Candidatus Cloacimonetes bacterium]|nr:YitT family protein [Candidatus Cloacimonadota bacterium]